MAAQQLSLGPTATADEGANGVESKADGVGDDGGGGGVGGVGRAPRLPRWTRQEILVLIQGKRVAETRVRRGRVGSAFGSGQVEPKWASVSSYCKRHGVNRGPVQCRKRWSNLAGDYKKIKEWEMRTKDETESFWVMRNDLRRERKLPGFFDREVYDILDHQGSSSASAAMAAVPEAELALALAPSSATAAAADEEEEEVEAEEEEREAVFDSGRSAAADDGLFSDFEQEDGGGRSPEKETETPVRTADAGAAAAAASAVPISEKQFDPALRGSQAQGGVNEKQPPLNPEIGSTSGETRKRKRPTVEAEEEAAGLQYHLIDVLERNGKLLTAQLEAQNHHLQLDRDQRRDQNNGLLAVLNKLADALGRIADKL